STSGRVLHAANGCDGVRGGPHRADSIRQVALAGSPRDLPGKRRAAPYTCLLTSEDLVELSADTATTNSSPNGPVEHTTVEVTLRVNGVDRTLQISPRVTLSRPSTPSSSRWTIRTSTRLGPRAWARSASPGWQRPSPTRS